MPRSSNVLTLALRSMNGVDSSTPFLMIRTTPFFCQTNRRPSGAHAMPTSEYGATAGDGLGGEVRIGEGIGDARSGQQRTAMRRRDRRRRDEHETT